VFLVDSLVWYYMDVHMNQVMILNDCVMSNNEFEYFYHIDWNRIDIRDEHKSRSPAILAIVTRNRNSDSSFRFSWRRSFDMIIAQCYWGLEFVDCWYRLWSNTKAGLLVHRFWNVILYIGNWACIHGKWNSNLKLFNFMRSLKSPSCSKQDEVRFFLNYRFGP
jgi:hypothetical protein